MEGNMRKRKEKVIVVDYDDTVVDFMGFLCRLHNKLYKTCITPSDFKAYDFDLVEIEDARGNKVHGKDIRETFLEYEKHGLYAALSLLPEAKFALKMFKELGYKIIILTARKEEYEKQTMMNVLNLNVPFDELIFCPSDLKAKKIRQLAKKYNIQMFADDKASTVKDVAETTNVNFVICINQSHNKSEEFDEDIIRCDGLMDAVRLLPDLTGD
jgi:uncharacterized HAD superfamily protein